MLTGKRFLLEKDTLSVEVQDGHRTAVFVPAGALIEVLSEPTGGPEDFINIRWESRIVSMFAVDVDMRGTEILEQTAVA